MLFDFGPAHNPVAFPSPRSWEFAHHALQKFHDQPQLLAGSLQACVGPAADIELHAFVQNLGQFPDLDAIVRGEEVPVPSETGLQYAVASALVSHAIRARGTPEAPTVYGRILDYAGRFPSREMGVVLVSDMHRVIGEELFAVPEFETWENVIADVMLFD